jgi:hypothetical protein
LAANADDFSEIIDERQREAIVDSFSGFVGRPPGGGGILTALTVLTRLTGLTASIHLLNTV